ncbi:hypothetical protein J2X45_001720 [Caulobacter sp. BE264]|uniref:hypothetical protein n=1 Tax=Caulobacter sp. BE264 TaxID=2817724 RepID=UPI0028666BFC|nr:hypothetical protein [Caulobacter sp. BE264]MDR7230629.1 hypothetical protein [Caulobacter sp. BE264]
MAWVEFTDKFRFVPPADRRVTVRYSAGQRLSVTAECARQAVEAGVAKRIKAPARGEVPDGAPEETAEANPVRED